MKWWDLTSLPPSTEKQYPREPGANAPRVPSQDGHIPRVLFSSPECRTVAIELRSGETMGDHHVRERAVVQVVKGRIRVEASADTAECAVGALLTFAPGERHSVHALEDATLVLLLAPWPAASHYTDATEAARAQELPVNASTDPIGA